ncbi:trypsin-like peptidase domain-containing protein [Fodinisporobacter ferrooxydans]|uniref:Trypsin-like peptidase domain-containing protein n=1 Tax=Fodinisporobacter ferrooxydans TaxID=2901836 RepID=A0ABY4CPK9_9BACL|nr:trypsin-like peptidase domain-containing protein [Alicyclobacillaceae bacterium MYW30-H2]
MNLQSQGVKGESQHSERLKWIVAIVISVLVGSATTFITLPILIKENWIHLPHPVIKSNDLIPTTLLSNQTVKESGGIVDAVNKVKKAVVGVVNYEKASDFLNQDSKTQEKGEGSGIIFDKQGFIITNDHVVQGAANIEVLLPDGKKTKAKVIGTDAYSDLAVLQIPSSYVTGVATFGNSDVLQVGEPVIAIGNPLGRNFSQTVTVGVISATKRTLSIPDRNSGQTLRTQAVLQTDAAINPGNSGGALSNIVGQVIGINRAKIATTGVEGM